METQTVIRTPGRIFAPVERPAPRARDHYSEVRRLRALAQAVACTLRKDGGFSRVVVTLQLADQTLTGDSDVVSKNRRRRRTTVKATPTQRLAAMRLQVSSLLRNARLPSCRLTLHTDTQVQHYACRLVQGTPTFTVP
jgi:hypothetical protein